MNELQKQKAIKALEKQKERERKQRHAMMYHLLAYADIHFNGVLLPYRVLYDLHKAEHDKTFQEVFPNRYYPAPAMTQKTKWGRPEYKGDKSKLPLKTLEIDGQILVVPDKMADPEYAKECEEYENRVKAEKMNIDKWGFYYARFLLPYDLESFTDFEFWGEIPKDEESKHVVESLKAAYLEVWRDCKEHPEEYNLEPIPRLEEHKTIYDVPYGYI